MIKKRSTFDVIATLLRILEEGDCRKTLLASRANLDSRASKRYMNFLLGLNLAAQDINSSCFKLTNKGRVYLREYRSLEQLITLLIFGSAITGTLVDVMA